MPGPWDRTGRCLWGGVSGRDLSLPGCLRQRKHPRGVEDAAPYDWVAVPGMGNTASSRRPVGRPPYVPLFGLCVGRGDPTPPKDYVVTRSTDGRRVCVIGCRGRHPRRPAGAWQTGVHGQPPGRACPAPTARLWDVCHLYYSRRAACPHAAEVRVAARSTGCRASSRRPVGRPPYVPLFGLCVCVASRSTGCCASSAEGSRPLPTD